MNERITNNGKTAAMMMRDSFQLTVSPTIKAVTIMDIDCINFENFSAMPVLIWFAFVVALTAIEPGPTSSKKAIS